MPRKPRIEIAGYYHVINRGVDQRVIFKEAEDYEYFEELLCTSRVKFFSNDEVFYISSVYAQHPSNQEKKLKSPLPNVSLLVL